MNLDEIRFKAIEHRDSPISNCAGCLFDKESFKTCEAACAMAVQHGMPDCDDKAPSGKTYIYVLDDSDPRQMDLLSKEH